MKYIYYIIILFIGIIIGRFLWYNNNNNESFIIKTLIRGCARWAIASKQDISPLISLLHANYAAGYLWAIKDVFTSEQIKGSTGINIVDFQNEITNIQDIATKKATNRCPPFASEIAENINLTRIAGDM